MMDFTMNTTKTVPIFNAWWFYIIYLISYFPIAVLISKKGEEYWKGFIPIYNTYLLFKIYWEIKYFICFVILFVGEIILIIISTIFMNPFGYLVAIPIILLILVVLALMIYIGINLYIKIAKEHKKSGWFVIGLLSFNIIFLYILAFDKQIQKFFDDID